MEINGKKSIIRLLKLELGNFKNVRYGKLEMPSLLKRTYYDDEAEVLGLYGQNGSGKTAVIDALVFLKCMLNGKALPENASDYIMAASESAECSFEFYFENGEKRCLADYTFVLQKQDVSDGGFCVSAESIYLRYIDENKKISQKKLVLGCDGKSMLKPKGLQSALYSANKKNQVELAVEKRLAEKEGRSYLFSDTMDEILSAALEDEDAVVILLRALKAYATDYLYIIRANIRAGAFPDQRLERRFDGLMENSIGDSVVFNLPAPYGAVFVPMNEPAVIPQTMFGVFRQAVEDTDRIMKYIIPDLRFKLCEYGSQLTHDGREGIRAEIISLRGGNKLPLKYESDGIKKLFSIFNILITMYKDESVCVVIDEFDSGIYEHLFGELIDVLGDYGRGQLIFTSHNLRPLETIDSEMLVFTTTNPENRYIRLEGNKNKNLRDVYLRSIDLGGQREQICETASSFDINRAFRSAHFCRPEGNEAEEE